MVGAQQYLLSRCVKRSHDSTVGLTAGGKICPDADIWRGNEMHHGQADGEEGRRMENAM